MPPINLKAGQTALLRVRALEDCSSLRGSFAPVLVEEDHPFPNIGYVGKVLAPFSELADPDSAEDIARLRRPRHIDPSTAKR